MASINKTKNGKWRVRWRQPTGAQTERSFNSKREADRFRRTVEDKIAQGKSWEVGSSIQLEDCISHYFEAQKVRWAKNTYKQRVLYLIQFVEWCFDVKAKNPTLSLLSDSLS